MTLEGLMLLLALNTNVGLMNTSHNGIEVPFYNQQTGTIYFPCHGKESPSPVGSWSNVTDMEEVYHILGLFYKEVTIEDTKNWVRRASYITPPWKEKLLADGGVGSLDALYDWCVKPYLEETGA